MDFEVKIDGLKEVEEALQDAGPTLARKALRKALKEAAAPLVEAARANAPVLKEGTPQRRPGELRDSIGVVVKTSPKNGSATAQIGPLYDGKSEGDSPGVYGMWVEFGSIHNPKPNPYMRRAFDGVSKEALDKFTEVLKAAIPELEKK